MWNGPVSPPWRTSCVTSYPTSPRILNTSNNRARHHIQSSSPRDATIIKRPGGTGRVGAWVLVNPPSFGAHVMQSNTRNDTCRQHIQTQAAQKERTRQDVRGSCGPARHSTQLNITCATLAKGPVEPSAEQTPTTDEDEREDCFGGDEARDSRRARTALQPREGEKRRQHQQHDRRYRGKASEGHGVPQNPQRTIPGPTHAHFFANREAHCAGDLAWWVPASV